MRAVLIVTNCPSCRARNEVAISGPLGTLPRCIECGQPVLSGLAVIEGYVYVLSNPAMPDLLKIGHTLHSLRKRVEQLSAPTSVPQPFAIEASFLSERPASDERAIHQAFATYRAPNREFFRLPLEHALGACARLLGRSPHYIRSLHGEYREPWDV